VPPDPFVATGVLVGVDVPVLVPEVVVVVVGAVVVVVGAVVVVVLVPVPQVGTEMTLSIRVTAPVWAKTRPSTLAPESSDTDASARIVPTKDVVLPSVAELPTCQKTLQAWAPFSRMTDAAEAVVKVDPAWKMNTAFASPPPSNVRGPVSCIALDARYTPGLSVRPPTVPPATVVKGVSLAATP
jgi:hypothetical protein